MYPNTSNSLLVQIYYSRYGMSDHSLFLYWSQLQQQGYLNNDNLLVVCAVPKGRINLFSLPISIFDLGVKIFDANATEFVDIRELGANFGVAYL